MESTTFASPRSQTNSCCRCPKDGVTSGSFLPQGRTPPMWSRRCAARTRCSRSRSSAKSNSPVSDLLRLLWNVSRWERGPGPEKEIFHVPRDQFLRFLLPRHQTVLVEDHLLPLFPHLPRLRGDVFINPLSEFTGPRW